MTILIYSYCYKQLFRTHSFIFTHLEVQCIYYQEWIVFFKWSVLESLHNGIQSFAQSGHQRFRELSATQLIGDVLRFPGGNTAYDHLHHGQQQSLLASLITFQEFCAEVPVKMSWYMQSQSTHASGQLSVPVTVTVSISFICTLVRSSTELDVRLSNQDLVEYFFQKPRKSLIFSI